ncbi:uncharacterized protein N7473_006715 [Penicillium subrubescens]|uniref:uncharacterized protein n=1 Tax=Penicillium subrubescens TaxID=1316194 RepID=UPI0025455E71|nr:uncharacterized protein N7473_006715 [Penicillium subrubescens]KAJ5890487.1 hypothetical protein N7473_006715 [Penicillium subrubescens]
MDKHYKPSATFYMYISRSPTTLQYPSTAPAISRNSPDLRILIAAISNSDDRAEILAISACPIPAISYVKPALSKCREHAQKL